MDSESAISRQPPRFVSAAEARARRIGLLVLLAALAAVFVRTLAELGRLAWSSDLYSYIPLIPVVSAYLIWLMRHEWIPAIRPSPALAIAPFAAGLALLCVGRFVLHPVAASDRLDAPVGALLLWLLALVLGLLGARAARMIAFPLAFLIFAVPLPSGLCLHLEDALRLGSAWVASAFFSSAATPFWRAGLVFHLPDISIEVAPECSGIHSTLVLFITSFLAGHLFLRSRWRQAALVAIVAPLALLRNGFRIFVIGELCVHVGPDMIDSPIHHKGGPIFFVLSLVPFLFFLRWLRRGGRGSAKTP